MSLAPSTDLVLEVSRAADPARAAAVTERLKALSSQGANSPQDFASTLASTAPPTLSAPVAAPLSRATKAERQLESVVMTEFISEMLPKDAPSAFGQGYAGDMWRSMLAEKVADQIAASGRLGIASRLFANKPLSSSAHLLSPDHGRGLSEPTAAQASANPLSAPSAADIEHGAFLFAKKT